VIAGLITLAIVGMLQSLGALADNVPVDPTWQSDAAGEDERGHAAGRGASSPDAVGAAAMGLPHRGEPTLAVVACTTAPASRIRPGSQASRAPPALLTHASV